MGYGEHNLRKLKGVQGMAPTMAKCITHLNFKEKSTALNLYRWFFIDILKWSTINAPALQLNKLDPKQTHQKIKPSFKADRFGAKTARKSRQAAVKTFLDLISSPWPGFETLTSLIYSIHMENTITRLGFEMLSNWRR